jgi:hypothetical protein
MTTQVRPATGGAWNTISQTTDRVTRKNTTFGVTLPPTLTTAALRALNEWVNCGGAGTAAVRAQGTAAAIGLQIQEI